MNGVEVADPRDKGLPRVYIVLVNWNNAPDTIACLESLAGLDYENKIVVVCDNGSTDGSLARILAWGNARAEMGLSAFSVVHEGEDWPQDQRLLDLVLVRCRTNHGFGGGNNAGLRFAIARGDLDYAWILNNDTLVDPQALSALVTRARADPRIGVCGSTILDADGDRRIQVRGGLVYDPAHARGDHIGEGDPFTYLDDAAVRSIESRMSAVQGASMLVSRSFLEIVGLMPEEFFLYCEEMEWSMRSAGRFRFGYAQDSIVYHKQGGTLDYDSESFASIYFFTRNRLRFNRMRFKAQVPRSYVHVLLVLLKRLVRGDLRGAGIMWRAIRDA